MCTKAVLPGLLGLVELGSHCPGTHSLQWGREHHRPEMLPPLLPPLHSPSSWGHRGHPESDTFCLCHVPISSLTAQMNRSVVWHMIFQSCGSWSPWDSHRHVPLLITQVTAWLLAAQAIVSLQGCGQIPSLCLGWLCAAPPHLTDHPHSTLAQMCPPQLGQKVHSSLQGPPAWPISSWWVRTEGSSSSTTPHREAHKGQPQLQPLLPGPAQAVQEAPRVKPSLLHCLF